MRLVPVQRQSPSWSLLVFGFAVPFFVWNCLMGFVIYVQHTHPRVAWYDRRDEWSANAGYATTTVHVKLMRPLDGLIHYILEHGAHHVNMGIPLYRLKEAQARLSATLGRAAEIGSLHLALLLEHGAALQAVRFRAARVDGFRRARHLRARVSSRLHRGRRRRSLLLQRRGVVAQVIGHEALHEVVAVVVPVCIRSSSFWPDFGRRSGEFLRH